MPVQIILTEVPVGHGNCVPPVTGLRGGGSDGVIPLRCGAYVSLSPLASIEQGDVRNVSTQARFSLQACSLPRQSIVQTLRERARQRSSLVLRR